MDEEKRLIDLIINDLEYNTKEWEFHVINTDNDEERIIKRLIRIYDVGIGFGYLNVLIYNKDDIRLVLSGDGKDIDISDRLGSNEKSYMAKKYNEISSSVRNEEREKVVKEFLQYMDIGT